MPKRKQTEAAKLGWKKRKGERDVENEHRQLCNGPSQPKQRKLWDNESMIMAIEAVKDIIMGVNQAAKEHGVPATPLKDRLSGRVEHGKRSGPMPYLTSQEEDELATFFKNASNVGYGKTKWDVLLIVQKTLQQRSLSLTITMGKGWYFRFMQRHPTLSFCN